MNRPSDRAYAQAVREMENEPKADRLSTESAAWWLSRRAREIDAAAPDGAQSVVSRGVEATGVVSTEQAAREMQGPEGAQPERGAFYVCPTCRGIGNVTRQTFDAYTTPPSQDAEDAARADDVGTWLWTQLMDWCKAQHCAPATQDALFSIVDRARMEFPAPLRQDRDDAALLRWCIKHSSWIRDDDRAYVAIPVAQSDDLSCFATTKAALIAARAAGGGGS